MKVCIISTNNLNVLNKINVDMTDEQFKQVGEEISELFVSVKLCKSKTECKNAIKQSGIKVQDIKITDVNARICHFENITYILQREI